MIAGHFGLAAGVKAKAPALPVWLLMLATQWLDVCFLPLVAFGIETVQPLGDEPGTGAIIHADYTHSLLGAVLLSVLFGAVCSRRVGASGATVLTAVAFSHWVLDLVMHRPDLPILPNNWGSLPHLGCGLWRYPAWSFLAEAALVLGGSWLYWRAALRAQSAHHAPLRKAHAAAGAALGSGLVVLALGNMGM